MCHPSPGGPGDLPRALDVLRRRDEWVERSVPRGLHPLDEAGDDIGPPSARTCEAYEQPRQDFERWKRC